MRLRFSFLALAIASPALAAVPPPPPPPMGGAPVGDVGKSFVLNWQPSEVTCGGGVRIAAASMVLPQPQPAISPFTAGLEPLTVSFAISAEGRAEAMRLPALQGMRFQTSDLLPSLRASRFVVGARQESCTIQYSPRTHPIADAPLETLARLGVAQRLRMGKDAWERLSPGDCRTGPRLAPLARSYPDFRKLERREGQREWTYVTYDVDRAGVPVNVATAYTSGYDALDAEARAAVAAGRYAGGPRTGCVQAWWTGADEIAAPPIPPKSETAGNPACEIEDRWERKPRLVFPPSYGERKVEGWAILRYDVAPWGQIGELAVVTAEPSAEFGEAAMNVIRNAKMKPLDSGLKGCIARVIFRIEGRPAENEADPQDS